MTHNDSNTDDCKKNVSCPLTLAAKLFENGRLQECRDALEGYLKCSPDDAGARELLGKALWSLGETDGAMRELEKSLEINPRQPQLLRHIFKRMGNEELAVAKWSFLVFLSGLADLNKLELSSDLLSRKICLDMNDLSSEMKARTKEYATDIKLLRRELEEIRVNVNDSKTRAVPNKHTLTMKSPPEAFYSIYPSASFQETPCQGSSMYRLCPSHVYSNTDTTSDHYLNNPTVYQSNYADTRVMKDENFLPSECTETNRTIKKYDVGVMTEMHIKPSISNSIIEAAILKAINPNRSNFTDADYVQSKSNGQSIDTNVKKATVSKISFKKGKATSARVNSFCSKRKSRGNMTQFDEERGDMLRKLRTHNGAKSTGKRNVVTVQHISKLENDLSVLKINDRTVLKQSSMVAFADEENSNASSTSTVHDPKDSSIVESKSSIQSAIVSDSRFLTSDNTLQQLGSTINLNGKESDIGLVEKLSSSEPLHIFGTQECGNSVELSSKIESSNKVILKFEDIIRKVIQSNDFGQKNEIPNIVKSARDINSNSIRNLIIESEINVPGTTHDDSNYIINVPGTTHDDSNYVIKYQGISKKGNPDKGDQIYNASNNLLKSKTANKRYVYTQSEHNLQELNHDKSCSKNILPMGQCTRNDLETDGDASGETFDNILMSLISKRSFSPPKCNRLKLSSKTKNSLAPLVEEALNNFRFDDTNLKYLPKVFDRIPEETQGACDCTDTTIGDEVSYLMEFRESYPSESTSNLPCNSHIRPLKSDIYNNSYLNSTFLPTKVEPNQTFGVGGTKNCDESILQAIETFGLGNHLILERLKAKPSSFGDSLSSEKSEYKQRVQQTNTTSQAVATTIVCSSIVKSSHKRHLNIHNFNDLCSKEVVCSIRKGIPNDFGHMSDITIDESDISKEDVNDMVPNDLCYSSVGGGDSHFFNMVYYESPAISLHNMAKDIINSLPNLSTSNLNLDRIYLKDSDYHGSCFTRHDSRLAICDSVNTFDILDDEIERDHHASIFDDVDMGYNTGNESLDQNPELNVRSNTSCIRWLITTSDQSNIICDDISRIIFRSVIISFQMNSVLYFKLPHVLDFNLRKRFTNETVRRVDEIDLVHSNKLRLLNPNLAEGMLEFVNSAKGCVLVCCNNNSALH